MKSLVEHGLLIQLLEIARGVAVHLDAVRRGRDSIVGAIHMILCGRLREDRRAGLSVGRHAEVEHVVPRLRNAVAAHVGVLRLRDRPAIAMLFLRHGRKMVLQVLDVKRVGELGELLAVAHARVEVVDWEV